MLKLFSKIKPKFSELVEGGMAIGLAILLVVLMIVLTFGFCIGMYFLGAWIIMLLWNFLAPMFGITFVFTIWHGLAVRICLAVLRSIFSRKTVIKYEE